MKFIYSILFISLSISLNAQDCTTYQDCLQKGIKGSSSDAEKVFGKAIKMANSDLEEAKAYFEMAKKLEREAKYDKKFIKKAIKSYEKAIKLNPSDYWPKEWLAGFYLTQVKDSDEAIKIYDEVLKENPNHARAIFRKGHVYFYQNQLTTSLPYFQQAKKLIETQTNSFDIHKSTKAEILLWEMAIRKRINQNYVYTKEELEELKSYRDLIENESTILGELALAYYDNDFLAQARAAADQALKLEGVTSADNSYQVKSKAALFVKGQQDFENKDYKSAAFRNSAAYERIINPHPAITYYRALSKFYYYATDATKHWVSNKALIQQGFQNTIKQVKDTKYEYLAVNAQKQLDAINAPNSKVGKDENFEKNFREFVINFSKMPSSYTLDYNSLRGRSIGHLKATQHYFGTGETNAIGLLCEGSNSYAFLVMVRTTRTNSQTTRFKVLSTDKAGNKNWIKDVCVTQKDMGRISVLGTFKLTISGNTFTLLGEDKHTNGHINKNTVTGSCL
ncbi:tetratricopeptide repeat protein [Mesonia sp.]|uniref:tetratricopeptide repeat protein n=1 Tax=Mesonia sp. TaxID=1960830 RepID=UPI00177293D5|nr:tetratricopeptide repeat protein [Mesonia sp.]HIB37334.1 hypothetical protein [Mesonia sp.]